MGTVWLADRADGQFEQRVALKLVKRGMDTDEILDRFRRERQILARLEHPGIARLLDGGVSEDDRPYFVMEHVAGEPITEHCDRRRLSIEERLPLFIAACRAVQYAHRNLVVHGDLKPANVLVTEGAEVKLLDFGIAKLLGEDDESTRRRGEAVALMTPEYASPEQVAGGPVTTVSDVYQLGALLYELLSGHRPYTASDRSPSEIRRAVLDSIPKRPSTAVGRTTTIVHRDGAQERIEPSAVGERRRTRPDRLRRRLQGDLDTIAMIALHKEPERRYPSPEDLARDVERHLEHLPLRFGADRLSYRVGKFVRRHRLGVASGAGIVLLLVGGVSFYTIQVRAERDRARLEAAKAAESAELVRRFFEGWDVEATARGDVNAGKVLGDAARRAERELQRDPETLAATLSMLGDLYTALGDLPAADSLLARALALQASLPSAPGGDLASTLSRRGRMLHARGRYREAEASLRGGVALFTSALGRNSAETLRARHDLAVTLWEGYRSPEAETILREILSASPSETWPFAVEATSQLGYILFDQARYDEAVAILRPALARQREMFGPSHRSTLLTMRNLAYALRDRGDLEEAEVLSREALAVTRSLYGPDHPETGVTASNLAILLERMGTFGEAEEFARQAADVAEQRSGPDHPDTALRLRTLGGIRLLRGDSVEAEAALRHSLDILRRAAPGHADEGDVLNRLAYILIARGDADGGVLYREAVAFDRARPAGSPVFVTDGLHFLAWAQHRKGDLAGAEANYRRALGLYRRQLANGHPDRAATATGLGAVLLDAGRPAEAQRYLREGLAQWEGRRPAELERVQEARALLDRARATAQP
jgi:serine/threonine-protein kinase